MSGRLTGASVVHAPTIYFAVYEERLGGELAGFAEWIWQHVPSAGADGLRQRLMNLAMRAYGAGIVDGFQQGVIAETERRSDNALDGRVADLLLVIVRAGLSVSGNEREALYKLEGELRKI